MPFPRADGQPQQPPPKKRCGAIKIRNGKEKACQAWPVIGMTRCRIHGGKSLGGLQSGTITHGRYSKYLPANLVEKYHEARKDKELTSLREEIFISDARLQELLEQLDKTEKVIAFKDLNSSFCRLVSALNDGNIEGALRQADRVQVLIDKGINDAHTWDEIRLQIETRRKLVETEHKRLVTMGQMITMDKAMGLVAFMTQSIQSNVIGNTEEDKALGQRIISGITADVRAVLSANPRTELVINYPETTTE